MSDETTPQDSAAMPPASAGSMTLQDRSPNFRDSKGRLFLVRCYACEGVRGRENWSPVVATGQCAWCGWSE